MSLRQAKEVDEVSKDLWVDSLEMTQVCHHRIASPPIGTRD